MPKTTRAIPPTVTSPTARNRSGVRPDEFSEFQEEVRRRYSP